MPSSASQILGNIGSKETLDIQDHLLRFDMWTPKKHTDQTPETPQEVMVPGCLGSCVALIFSDVFKKERLEHVRPQKINMLAHSAVLDPEKKRFERLIFSTK